MKNIFAHLVAANVADTLGEATYFQFIPRLSTVEHLDELMRDTLRHSHLSATIWICAFSVNQHSWICKNIHEGWSHTCVRRSPHDASSQCSCVTPKFSDGYFSEMNKFDDMIGMLQEIHGEGFRQLIALDKLGDCLDRAWVVAEIAKCQRSSITQHALVHFPVHLAGSAMKDKIDNNDVEKCEARVEQDKIDILAKIDDKAAYNAMIRQTIQDLVLPLHTGDGFGWVLVSPRIIALVLMAVFLLGICGAVGYLVFFGPS